MPLPDPKAKTIVETIEEERLQKWREKRAKVAEASRQERIKATEAERRSRLEAFEIEKAQRVRDAAEKRAREEAARTAERMAIARSRIAGRTDIEAARKRLLKYRRRAAKMLAVRLFVFVACPTLAFAAYLLTIATPFYTSEVQFALQNPQSAGVQTSQTPFASTAMSREAHLLRQVLISPSMAEVLDNKNGFTAHLSSAKIDPLRRIGGPLQVLFGERALERYVDVSVNGQDGIVSIKTRAADPKKAQAFAGTILSFAQTWLGNSDAGVAPMLLITKPTLATGPRDPYHISTLTMIFLSFCALYAFLAIFVRTLLRHSEH